jgi:hypothetical protein
VQFRVHRKPFAVVSRTTLHPARYTLGVMEAKRVPSEQPGAAGAEGGLERYGPLGLRRLRKDDGRALIAYTRVEPPSVLDAREPGAGAVVPAPEQ